MKKNTEKQKSYSKTIALIQEVMEIVKNNVNILNSARDGKKNIDCDLTTDQRDRKGKLKNEKRNITRERKKNF